MDSLRDGLAADPSEVFNAWIEFRKFRQIVEGGVSVAVNEVSEDCLNGNDVHEEAVFVQTATLQPDFDLIAMGVQIVFGAPITTDEVVLPDEISFDRYGIHLLVPVLSAVSLDRRR